MTRTSSLYCRVAAGMNFFKLAALFPRVHVNWLRNFIQKLVKWSDGMGELSGVEIMGDTQTLYYWYKCSQTKYLLLLLLFAPLFFELSLIYLYLFRLDTREKAYKHSK